MEVNGSLVFDTFAGSEIKKLRVEKVSVNPSAVMSDVGRLIYNTATKQFLIGRDNGNSTYMWDLITTSTSSDIATIQTEIDAIELAMGLKADGTFDPTKFTGTLAGKTSYVDLIATLQTLVASASAAADAKLPLAGGTVTGVLSVNGAGNTTIGVSGTQAQGTQKLSIANCANFYVSSGNFINPSAANLTLSANTVTGRSVNASGTVNASGADYAEYMHKSTNCGVVVPGQVIGVDSHGRLTDKWDEAISFMIKSTDPCMVGGDKWAAHLGDRPSPVERIPGDTDAEWSAKQAPLIAFEVELQVARQMVDRIAFCGQVPVNVYGASPGDYIIPSRDGHTITGIPISEDDITMKQYIRSIGRVIRIDDDGRAHVVVKVA